MKVNFKTVELDEVCTKISVGLAIAVTPFMAEAGVKLIRNQNIRPNKFDASSLVFLTTDFAVTQVSKKIRENDVVVVRTGSNIGNACVVPKEFDESQSFTTLVARPNPKVLDSYYLAQFINSHFGCSEVNRLMAGGGKGNLNSGELERFRITLPLLPEQAAIASLLSIWDLGIEKVERLIAAKEQQLTSLVKSQIADKCDRWAHLRADKIFKSISEKQNDNEELLSVTQDRGVIPRSMLEGRVMSPESGTDTYKLIKVGDFAISLRSFQGGIEYSRYQGLISPAYTVLRPKLEIDDDFYRHFFKSYLFIEKYLSIAVIGIRDGKQISIPDFMTVKIPLPPISEQKQIAAILTTASQEIDLLKKQAGAHRRQKRGLMQKLLTGEWRVPSMKENS